MSKVAPPQPPVSSASDVSDAVLAAYEATRAGCAELLPEMDWLRKLARSAATRRPLTIKLGLDPTAPDIHLGHTIVLDKLRLLQDLGHQVVFLIGDFTSTIGDPSGRNTTRPPLSREQVIANAATYCEQAARVLDMSRASVRYNSTWCDQLGARGLIELAGRYTVARLMEREDFRLRFKAGVPIAVHEFLYPLLQGHDSVVLRSDLELGGTDQTFNVLMGRHLQQEMGQEPQCVMTMPLLVGLDGVEKMSKSKGNTIGVTEEPNSMFAKLMSISDELMWDYLGLLKVLDVSELGQRRLACDQGANPRDVKALLARSVVQRFHGHVAADLAATDFAVRARGEIPDHIPSCDRQLSGGGIAALLKSVGLTTSIGEAHRLAQQGGIRIDGEPVQDLSRSLAAGTFVLQVGKRRFMRVTLTQPAQLPR